MAVMLIELMPFQREYAHKHVKQTCQTTTKCFFFPSLSGKHLEILFWDNSDLKFKKGSAEVSLRYQIVHFVLKKNSHFKYLPW